MRMIVAFAAGLLFGAGLLLSGMTDPAKVQNFLDVFGSWDPSLAFVMGGAVAVTSVGYALSRRARAPRLATAFGWPTGRDVDAPLVLGAAVFGLGWGLIGLCPGPALTALPTGEGGVLAFVAAMLAGFAAARWYRARPGGEGSVAERDRPAVRRRRHGTEPGAGGGGDDRQ